MIRLLLSLVLLALVSCHGAPGDPDGSLGTRVLVVERNSGSLAVYDYAERRLLPNRITGLGDLQHATITFSPDLRYGFLATRSGKLVRIDLRTLRADGEVVTSSNSIDNAVSHDGKTIAVAEYIPGGVTLVDSSTLRIKKRINADNSRVTGMVDAPGNKFVCVLIEKSEIWILDPTRDDPIERRIPAGEGMPYDAMITADGRYYLVGKLGTDRVAVLDLVRPEAGVKEVTLRDPMTPPADKGSPKKLPHMASWAVAGNHVFVPTVGEKRIAVLDRTNFSYLRSVPVRGHPVYVVRSPTEREVWVTFSGDGDDAWIDVVDTETLEVIRSMRVGRRIYHLDFTPRGSHALATANADDELVLIDATRYQVVDREKLASPSGIFGAWRAFRIGL